MDDRPTLFEIPWLRLFPRLRLFRAPGAAVDLKRLTIAVVGLVALEAGWGVLDRIIPGMGATSPIGVFAWGGETPSAAEPFNRLSDPFVRLFQACSLRGPRAQRPGGALGSGRLGALRRCDHANRGG